MQRPKTFCHNRSNDECIESYFGFQIRLDLADLLGDDVGEVLQTLLDGILGHVPPELRHVGGQVHPVGQQVLAELVALLLQHLAQVVGDLPRDLLHEPVQLAQVVRQPHQLVQRANLPQVQCTWMWNNGQ